MSIRNIDLIKLIARNTTKINKFYRCYSISSQALVSDNVEYPPIKPKYPPGKWGSMAKWKTWEMHTREKELSSIENTKEKLESIAGDDSQPITIIRPFEMWPNDLEYKQFMTKTHLAASPLEDLYKTPTSESLLDKLQPIVEHVIEQELRKETSPLTSAAQSTDIWNRVLDVLSAYLSADHPHLRLASYDRDVPIKSFFMRRLAVDEKFDFDEDTMLQRKRDRFYDEDVDDDEFMWPEMRMAQILQQSLYQIRTHTPLPNNLARDDALCTSGDYPVIKYAPEIVDQTSTEDRPISQLGYWLGEECNNFAHTTVHAMPTQDYADFKDTRDPSALERLWTAHGVVSGFASCSAQAHNIGSNLYTDIETPITCQQMCVEGSNVRFHVYQLNTLQLWKDDQANPLRNIHWQSKTMSLYDESTSKVNRSTLDLVMRVLTLKPAEGRPRSSIQHINDAGTKPLPKVPIGRWQYPRKPVYTYF